jgi:beta-alanine--pyruvate transaminase
MMAAIELEPRPGEPALRANETFRRCFEAGLLIRTTGDSLALTPPLIIDKDQIGQIVDTIGTVLQSIN